MSCNDSSQGRKRIVGNTIHRKNIKGALLEHDIIKIERVISSCEIFELHTPVSMHKDFFWSVICPRTVVGSPKDHDQTNMPYSEHKNVFLARIVREQNSMMKLMSLQTMMRMVL